MDSISDFFHWNKRKHTSKFEPSNYIQWSVYLTTLALITACVRNIRSFIFNTSSTAEWTAARCGSLLPYVIIHKGRGCTFENRNQQLLWTRLCSFFCPRCQSKNYVPIIWEQSLCVKRKHTHLRVKEPQSLLSLPLFIRQPPICSSSLVLAFMRWISFSIPSRFLFWWYLIKLNPNSLLLFNLPRTNKVIFLTPDQHAAGCVKNRFFQKGLYLICSLKIFSFC